MITWPAFSRYAAEARRHVPRAVYRDVVGRACDRLREGLAGGRADGPLDFTDLANEIEAAIGPRGRA